MSDDGQSKRGVLATYDRIAAHFSRTRAHPWPDVQRFVEQADRVETALDIGCGNGRHAELLTETAATVVGLDASRRLLAHAGDRFAPPGSGHALLQGDAERLPVRAGVVDLGLYVATLHHLPSRAARVASLDDLDRVLAPDGRALVSVWATAHERFDGSADDQVGFDATVEWTLPDGTAVPRYYHVYALPEFEADIRAAGLTLHESCLSRGNCYAVVGPGGTGA